MKFKIEHYDFIDKCYRDNDELTANDLQKMLQDTFDLNLSISSIKRVRKKLGWKQSGPRYCQAIRPANCIKRLAIRIQDLTRFNKLFGLDSLIWAKINDRMMTL